MSLFVPFRRATLLIPSGPADDPDRKHLFILLTDPVVGGSGEKESLLVGVSSVRQGAFHDPTCILYPGDHPFIRRDSFIAYGRARIELSQKLINGVQAGVLAPRETLDGAVFARVCQGLLDSRHTAPKIRAFYSAATG